MWQSQLRTSIGCQLRKGPGPFSTAFRCRWLLPATLAIWAWAVLAAEPEPATVGARRQEQVIQLLQTVVQDYWSSGDVKSAGPTNRAGSYTNLEAAFRKASELMPQRLDLRFGVASSLVIQAVQTNGQQLELKLKEALGVYREIQSLDTNGFAAPILYAAYTRAIGQTNTSEAAINWLMTVCPGRTSDYLQKFSLIDSVLQISPEDRLSNTMPRDKHHAIVVLGAGLETNGMVKPKLAGRLDQCLKLARMYPRAPIILTGGNQKGGVTEAYAMSLWCRHRGISRKRLILEDQAKDTVENALFSTGILQRLGVTHVTLVTSSSHIRRGLADLEEACLQRGLKVQYATLTSKQGDVALDKSQERIGIYRDVMRLSGLWDFPGLQR